MNSIAFHPTDRRIVNIMLDMVEHNGRVLEPGFGEGAFLSELIKKPFNEIEGVEYSKDFFNKANFENVNLIHQDYLQFKPNKKYNLIIGNPPYMKYSGIDSTSVQKEIFNLTKTKASDIYYAFIIKSIMLLEEEGVLLFLLPSTFFVNKYASYLREFMLENGYFEKIIDFGELRIFETANVEAIIFKYVKSKKKKGNIEIIKSKSRVKIDKAINQLSKANLEKKSNEDFDYFTREQFKLEDKYWTINNRHREFKSVKLKSILDIGVGIVSGCDEVFKIPANELSKFNAEEKTLFVYKFLKSNNLESYLANNNLTKMVFINKYISDENKLKPYPNLLNYFQKNKDILENRYFSSPKKPYFYWMAIRNLDKIKDNKDNAIIAVPSLSRKKSQWFSISYTKNKYISSDILFLLPKEKDDLYFILGYLNSDFFSRYYKMNGKKKGERFVFNQGFMEDIEIPFFDKKDKKMIAEMTEKIIASMKRNRNSNSIPKNRDKIEEIIRNGIRDLEGKKIYGQLSFDF